MCIFLPNNIHFIFHQNFIFLVVRELGQGSQADDILWYFV